MEENVWEGSLSTALHQSRLNSKRALLAGPDVGG